MDSLYRELVLEHYRHPRNFGPVEGFEHVAEAENSLCGDRIRIGLNLKSGLIAAAGFHGRGCAICMASASLLTEYLCGQPVSAARGLHGLLLAELATPADKLLCPPLQALTAVKEHAPRHRCLLLSAEALRDALASLPS